MIQEKREKKIMREKITVKIDNKKERENMCRDDEREIEIREEKEKIL